MPPPPRRTHGSWGPTLEEAPTQAEGRSHLKQKQYGLAAQAFREARTSSHNGDQAAAYHEFFNLMELKSLWWGGDHSAAFLRMQALAPAAELSLQHNRLLLSEIWATLAEAASNIAEALSAEAAPWALANGSLAGGTACTGVLAESGVPSGAAGPGLAGGAADSAADLDRGVHSRWAALSPEQQKADSLRVGLAACQSARSASEGLPWSQARLWELQARLVALRCSCEHPSAQAQAEAEPRRRTHCRCSALADSAGAMQRCVEASDACARVRSEASGAGTGAKGRRQTAGKAAGKETKAENETKQHRGFVAVLRLLQVRSGPALAPYYQEWSAAAAD